MAKYIRNYPSGEQPGIHNIPLRKFVLKLKYLGGSVVGHEPYPNSPGGYEKDEFYYVHPLLLKDAPWWVSLNSAERVALQKLYPDEVLRF